VTLWTVLSTLLISVFSNRLVTILNEHKDQCEEQKLKGVRNIQDNSYVSPETPTIIWNDNTFVETK
jgi:hypothetical protein